MRAEELLQWVAHPDSLDTTSLDTLRRVTKEFPYFQTTNMLYLMNLKKVKDTDFQQVLRKVTLYAGDRRKLFLLVEADRFASLDINGLGKKDRPVADSSFALIDLFLSDYQTGKPVMVTEEEPLELYSKSVANADYLSTLSAGEEDAPQTDSHANPLEHQDIIDSFLEKDKEAPIKIDLGQLTDSLPTPEDENEPMFFSETLAKIYLKQKKYDKALEIIRKLNLLYPEKNIYFADQIRFLEKLITNIQKTE